MIKELLNKQQENKYSLLCLLGCGGRLKEGWKTAKTLAAKLKLVKYFLTKQKLIAKLMVNYFSPILSSRVITQQFLSSPKLRPPTTPSTWGERDTWNCRVITTIAMCGASNEQKFYFQPKYLIKNEISTSLVCKLLKECSININLSL